MRNDQKATDHLQKILGKELNQISADDLNIINSAFDKAHEFFQAIATNAEKLFEQMQKKSGQSEIKISAQKHFKQNMPTVEGLTENIFHPECWMGVYDGSGERFITTSTQNKPDSLVSMHGEDKSTQAPGKFMLHLMNQIKAVQNKNLSPTIKQKLTQFIQELENICAHYPTAWWFSDYDTYLGIIKLEWFLNHPQGAPYFYYITTTACQHFYTAYASLVGEENTKQFEALNPVENKKDIDEILGDDKTKVPTKLQQRLQQAFHFAQKYFDALEKTYQDFERLNQSDWGKRDTISQYLAEHMPTVVYPKILGGKDQFFYFDAFMGQYLGKHYGFQYFPEEDISTLHDKDNEATPGRFMLNLIRLLEETSRIEGFSENRRKSFEYFVWNLKKICADYPTRSWFNQKEKASRLCDADSFQKDDKEGVKYVLSFMQAAFSGFANAKLLLKEQYFEVQAVDDPSQLACVRFIEQPIDYVTEILGEEKNLFSSKEQEDLSRAMTYAKKFFVSIETTKNQIKREVNLLKSGLAVVQDRERVISYLSRRIPYIGEHQTINQGATFYLTSCIGEYDGGGSPRFIPNSNKPDNLSGLHHSNESQEPGKFMLHLINTVKEIQNKAFLSQSKKAALLKFISTLEALCKDFPLARSIRGAGDDLDGYLAFKAYIIEWAQGTSPSDRKDAGYVLGFMEKAITTFEEAYRLLVSLPVALASSVDVLPSYTQAMTRGFGGEYPMVLPNHTEVVEAPPPSYSSVSQASNSPTFFAAAGATSINTAMDLMFSLFEEVRKATASQNLDFLNIPSEYFTKEGQKHFLQAVIQFFKLATSAVNTYYSSKAERKKDEENRAEIHEKIITHFVKDPRVVTINVQDENGKTLLMELLTPYPLGMHFAHQHLFRFLLGLVDLNLTDSKNATVLDYAMLALDNDANQVCNPEDSDDDVPRLAWSSDQAKTYIRALITKGVVSYDSRQLEKLPEAVRDYIEEQLLELSPNQTTCS